MHLPTPYVALNPTEAQYCIAADKLRTILSPAQRKNWTARQAVVAGAGALNLLSAMGPLLSIAQAELRRLDNEIAEDGKTAANQLYRSVLHTDICAAELAMALVGALPADVQDVAA